MDAYDIRGLRKISVHHYKGEEGKSQFILKISDGDHFSARSASCTSKKDANLNDFSYKTWEKRVLLGKIAGKMKEKYKTYITGTRITAWICRNDMAADPNCKTTKRKGHKFETIV